MLAEKRKNAERLKGLIRRRAEEKARQSASRQEAGRLRDILSSWDQLTAEERRAVIRACVGRVTLTHGRIDVDFIA